MKTTLRNRLYAVITAGVVLLIASCAKEARFDLPIINNDVPEGMVRIQIDPRLETAGAVTTRTGASANDSQLTGTIYVMVTNTNDLTTATLSQVPAVGTMVGGKLQATLFLQNSTCYLLVVANISAQAKAVLEGLTAGTPINSILTQLKNNLPTTNIKLASPFPMYGWSGQIDKLERGSTNNPTILTQTVRFIRSVARIDIDGSAATFAIHGAKLINGAPFGYILPNTLLPSFEPMEVYPYEEQTNPTPPYIMNDQIFCFENGGNTEGASVKATRIVIKGQPTGSADASYYPIDIIYPDPLVTTKSLADIERNKLYKIVFSKVEKDGYRTADEAARSEAFNNQVEMNIVVTDPYAYDITTNGKQYLGVTNSEFVLYPRPSANGTEMDVAGVHITSFTYTCDPGWAAGEIKLPSGITMATGNTTRLDVSNTPMMRDLIVNIPSGFTEDIIVIHIGNLRKEIKVRRKPATSPTGDVYKDYFAQPTPANPDYYKTFKTGEIISPSADTEWLKVSDSETIGIGGSSLNNKVVHPEGGIYIHAQPNVGFESAVYNREAYLYVAGEKDNERIKVMVQQSTFDVYSGTIQIEPYSYVGTFHRWNEMGERLIRIKADVTKMTGGITVNNMWWQADVVAGREFIVLDTLPTKDTGIRIFDANNVNWNGVGDNPVWSSSAAIESAGKEGMIQGASRSVKGSGINIYFRVGLTGCLSSPSAQPRYGLITISYGKNGGPTIGKHNIYVRQGEAPDYLMRPWDPSTTHPNGWYEYKYSSRPMARKFSPYHLTDPQQGDGLVDRGARGYGFVEYPSQGGYFFYASGTRAVSPTVTTNQGFTPPSFNISNSWQNAWETCPPGYRRPADGKDRKYLDRYTSPPDPGGDAPYYPTDIIDSELRQSVWLYPLHSGFKSDFTNQIRGYLADGYFDRREIKISDDIVDKTTRYSIVEKGSKRAAFWGFLVFNPHNYASMFFPLNGYYNSMPFGKRINEVAKTGNIQTRTAGSGDNDGWLVSYGYVYYQFTEDWAFDFYQKSASTDSYSIRCIKDEEATVSSGSDQGKDGVTDMDPIDRPGDINTSSQLAIRHFYTGTTSLQDQIESEYQTPEIRKRINSIVISGDMKLTTADYAYLNDWANGNGNINGADYSGSILRHLIIRGTANAEIPAGAFTSSNWSSVILFDATTIKENAFAAGVVGGSLPNNVTGMRNLTLGCLDAITVEANAFGFNTSLVQLHVGKESDEYKLRVEGTTWTPLSGHPYVWSAIKGE